ncbi:hypothetical protein VTO42DRAFT_7541 [Malbranchea cinnamomea]
MAAPRTQLLRLCRVTFPPSPVSKAALNLNSPLPRHFVRCVASLSASFSNNATPPPLPQLSSSSFSSRSTSTVLQPPEPPRKLPPSEPKVSRKYGTVISAGRMNKTVRVQVIHTEYDKHIRRPFPAKSTVMVSDPRNSLREGDVIQFASGWRTSKNVRHVVERIIAPFGTPIEERPPIPTREELEAERKAKKGKTKGAKLGKIKQRVLRRLAIERQKADYKRKLEMERERHRQEIERAKERDNTPEKRALAAAKARDEAKKAKFEERWRKEEMTILEKYLKKAVTKDSQDTWKRE